MKEDLIQKVWKNNIDRKEIKRIIDSYKSKIEITKNGDISQNGCNVNWDFQIQILKTSIKKRVDESMILFALAHYDKKSDDSLLYFTERLNDLIIKRDKEPKVLCNESLIYIFPTSIRMDEEYIRNTKIFNATVSLVNNRYLKKSKNIGYFISPITKQQFYKYNDNYLIVKNCSTMTNSYIVLDYLYSCVDLITLWNSTSLNGHLNTHLLLPEWCLIVDGDNQNLMSLNNNSSLSMGRNNLNKKTYSNIKHLLSITNFDLGVSDNRIEILIVNMVFFFAEALRSQKSSIKFHFYWLILEAIVRLSNVNMNQDKIINRLDAVIRIFENVNMNYKNLLIYWKKIRNRIAHNGFDDISCGDMNAIKRVAAKSIFWLYNNRKAFPTIDYLEEFYNSVSMAKDKLEIRKIITSKLLKKKEL